MNRLAALALGFAVAFPAPAGADGADQATEAELRQLIDRAENALRSDTAASVFEMEIKTGSYERSYKIVTWDDRRGEDKFLVKILGPALWRGFGTLKVGKQLKLFNPKTNHVTVVSASMLGDAWMGSHFTNDDLVHETQLHRDYDLGLDAKTTQGAMTIYRVNMRPRPTAPVAWARIVYTVAVEGERILPRQAEYYRRDRDAQPSRTMTFDELGRLGGREVPTRMTVTVTDKPGEYTRITYKTLEFDLAIPPTKFTEQALRK
jgi:hypothetical protein